MSGLTVAGPDVTVVGAGVIGLTCAHALRGAGYRVTVIAADRPRVSDVAGGLWLPYAAGDSDEVMGWALETLAPTAMVPRTVTSLDEIRGLVVNCSGLAARELAGDRTVSAARGQVVHLTPMPGVPCVCDEDQMIYVLPRKDRTIVGGSYQPGNEHDAVDPAETDALLARACALVPQLARAEVLDARAGLRPVRAGGPRVERVGDVIHCYGHGGAGLTLSWGCARRVVELAAGG